MTEYLLDTHVWLWLSFDSDRVPAHVQRTLADTSHAVALSSASVWEVVIKHASGKLPLPADPRQLVPMLLQAQGVTVVPVELRHTLALAELGHDIKHRDPFDRMLVAQARDRGATIVTVDNAFAAYGVETLDPRA